MKKKVVLIPIVIGLITSIAFLTFLIYKKTSFDGQFKEMLRENGWGEVLRGGLDNSADISSKYLNTVAKGVLKDKLIEASIKSGFDPSEYMGKGYDIEEYRYELSKSSGRAPLKAIFCVYKGKIICACITHSEIGVRGNYWPLSAKYSQIIKYIGENSILKP